jgi:tetratricopeptide (TPR) repeat protein
LLSHTRRFVLALALLLAAILVPSIRTSEPKPTPNQIAEWIEQLGDDDFRARENASKKLWQAGSAAEAALEKAIGSNDREVSRRARELLDKFRWGIYPDTPADIVALVRAYQSSGGVVRLEVLQKLLAGGEAGLRAALKIAAAEKDEGQRKLLADLIAVKLPAAYYRAVTEGKHEPFERLLDLGHGAKFVGANQYASYWLLRGQLAERITHFQTRLREHSDDKWTAQTLAYLYRAYGDLPAAHKAAEMSGRTDLVEGILYELADWQALVELTEKTTAAKPHLGPPYHDLAWAENPAENWAYRAAYTRLAGKQEAFDRAVCELLKFGDFKNKGETYVFAAAKGLLLNDRPAEGLDLLRTLPKHGTLLFDLLCARLDFAEALELAVKPVPNNKDVSNLDFARARLLHLLGEREGERLFDRYGARIEDGIDPKWVVSLLAEEIRAGLTEKAFAHAAKALSVAPPKIWREFLETRDRDYFQQLFPEQATTAEVWWTVLRRQFKDDAPVVVLKRLRQLLEGKIAAKEVKAWIESDQGYRELVPSNNIPGRQMTAWSVGLAEGALLAGLDDLALSELERTVRSLGSPRAALLRLGDLLAAKKQWAKAAERYRQAWTKQSHPEERRLAGGSYDPLPLYLAGDALIHAGKEREGKELIEQAHWIPYADAEMRFNFVRALAERGHKDAARRETELLLRVSEPNTYYSGTALRRMANAALMRKAYRKAAEGFEQSMLRCFHPGTNFVSDAALANAPAQIHQLRASGLLAEGKLAEALKHVELALLASPGYADLPIELVPELERRGHKKEAADLFNRCYGVYEKVCRAYPRYAWAHNSAAWMSACCRRNLDQALQHANRAVELAPNHAGYLDTLAEVHFQRGDRDKAIALQKRAIALEPKKSYFQRQLQRLESGKPSNALPAEDDE